MIGLIAVAGLGWYMWSRQSAAKDQASAGAGGPAAQTVIRTASVRKGSLMQTLRLTGSTGAERYASLLVPQLRGSRGDGLRDGKTFSSPGANYNITSNAGRSTGGNSVGASPSSGSGGGDLASTMGQSSGGSAALRSATSRVSGGSRGSGGTMSSGSSADAGLGSTAGALVGTGGSGGGGGGGSTGGGGGSTRGGGSSGGGDYSMVLQSTGKSGGMVKKGDSVAEFDRVNMLNRLEDYHASVAQMDASFIKLKAEVEAQRKARLQSLDNSKSALDQALLDVKTIPVLSAIEAERTKLAAEEADAKYKQLVAELKFAEASYASQIRIADLELQQAHVELKRAEANTDRMIMKAPINGLIVMQTIFRGSEMAQIQAGDQLYSGMRFMQIVDPSSMILNTSLNQVDSDLIRVGAKARVRFDAFPGLELPATVQAIGAMTRPAMMRAAFVKEIPVILKLDKLDPRVIPDLSVSVDVEIASAQESTIAPLAAVFEDDSQANVTWAWVRKETGWEKRQVQVGISSNLDVVIKSGLQPGEIVALDRPPDESSGQARKQG
ncbi:MAG: efflux RND transporter periplasmic adaptor subunit [Bryobacteraceae bacterium]|nr:efflux RND transporter periplasmic adaptor subunit [Bryobacteraceae bacterium]